MGSDQGLTRNSMPSNQHYKDSLFYSSDGVWEIDVNLKTLMVNPAMEKILNYSANELQKISVLDVVIGPHAVVLSRQVQINKTPTRISHHINLLGKDGLRIVSNCTLIPVFVEDIRISTLLLFENLSDRKQPGQILWDIQTHFRTLFDQTSDAIFLENAEQDIIDANLQACRLFGYSREDLLRMKTGALQVLKSDNLLVHPIYSSSDMEQDSPFEATGIHRSGHSIPIEISVSVLEYGGVRLILSIVRDIRRRKKVEMALQQSEARLRQIIDLVPHMIFAKNIDGKFLLANQAMAKAYGLTVEKLTGRYHQEVHLFKEEFDRYLRDDRKVIETGESVFIPEESFRYNNEFRYLQTTKIPYSFSDSDEAAALGVAVDITDRKIAEIELQNARDQLRAVLDSVPGLISWISSDLKYLGVNKQLAEAQGKTPEDFTNQQIGFLHSFSSFEDFVRDFFSTNLDSQKHELVFSINNEDRNYLLIAQKYFGGKSAVFVGIDITERKWMETALRKSEEFNRAVIENSPVGVSVRSPKDKLISVNKAWLRIWGLPEEYPFEELQYIPNEEERKEYFGSYLPNVNAIYQHGGSLFIPELHVENPLKNGAEWISHYFYAIRNLEGSVDRVVILTANITENIRSRIALESRDKILSSLSKAADVLLCEKDINLAISSALEYLSVGSDISRIYIFENEQDDGVLTMSQRFEWVNEQVKPQGKNPKLQKLPYNSAGFGRWREKLQIGDVIYGLVRDFPPAEQQLLKDQEIQAIIIVPIFVDQLWWGFIGFDECFKERIWTPTEIDVLKSSASLIGSTLERHRALAEIQHMNEMLELRIEARTKDLQEANSALAESLSTLKKTFNHLVQSEKMAALAHLVGGVAHEINTPVGVGVTAASYLKQITSEVFEKYETGKLSETQFRSYLSNAVQSAEMTLINLNRAADLIRSFKQVAVDQSSENLRLFNLKRYIGEILLSLSPKLKRTEHKIQVNCPEDLDINSYPGSFSQILTNLIMNSLIHAFPDKKNGQILIKAERSNNKLILEYSDDGCGILPQHLNHIFDPFFTTKRSEGGSGLGMHIVYNLVTQNLNGKILCTSKPNKGTVFSIELPL